MTDTEMVAPVAQVEANVVFEIRNDKDRGNLVVTIRNENDGNVFFFKYHHQPIEQHPEQVQEIVRLSKPTMRTKSINVDILAFLRQYWDGTTFEFKGVKMNSTNKQISKVYNRVANKEIIKRKQTIDETKQKKVTEKNKQILQKLQDDEAKFQAERAIRLAELMKP